MRFFGNQCSNEHYTHGADREPVGDIGHGQDVVFWGRCDCYDGDYDLIVRLWYTWGGGSEGQNVEQVWHITGECDDMNLIEAIKW